MLLEVYDAFSKGRSFVDIGSDDFLRLFGEFNRVATADAASQALTTVGGGIISCGAESTLAQAVVRKELQSSYGKTQTLYAPSKFIYKTSFYPDFKHGDFADHYYRNYFAKNLARDPVLAVCDFISFCDSAVHLAPDGNARAGLLFGWFASIMLNQSLPIMWDQYLVHPTCLEEGRAWSERFFDNPAIDVAPELAEFPERLKQDVVRTNSAECCELLFLNLVVSESLNSDGFPLFLPVSMYEDIYVGKSTGIPAIEGARIMFSQRSNVEATDVVKFSFARMLAGMKINLEKIQEIADEDTRHATFALELIKSAAENIRDFESEDIIILLPINS